MPWARGPIRIFPLVQASLAGRTGFEPATSCVTGMRSNQLNYRPKPRLKMAADENRDLIIVTLTRATAYL